MSDLDVELRLGNVSSTSVAKSGQSTVTPKVTQWTFEDEDKVFIGVEGWSSPTTIHSVNVVYMDVKCIQQEAAIAENSGLSNGLESGLEQDKAGKDSATEILIISIFSSALVLLVLFALVVRLVQSKQKQQSVLKTVANESVSLER